MKKLLALILAALMIATLAACSDKDNSKQEGLLQQNEEAVDHVTNDKGETFYFDIIDTETVSITAYTSGDEKHALEIPAELDGKTVVSISTGAFRSCTAITSFTLPASVTKIGDYAFEGCAELTEINIPATVQTIGVGAFHGCSSATKLNFAEGCRISTIEMNTFNACSSLEKITVPAQVKTVKQGAFYGCSSAAEIVIERGVEIIEKQAFQDCTALTTVSISGFVIVGQQAFSGGSDDQQIVYSDNTQVIYLEDVDSDTVAISQYVGGATAHTLTIPRTIGEKTVVAIKDTAFKGCTSLTSVTVAGSVKTIGASAFADCTALTEVILADGIKTIDALAFSGCTELTTCKLPKDIVVDDTAFSGCDKLQSDPEVGPGSAEA